MERLTAMERVNTALMVLRTGSATDNDLYAAARRVLIEALKDKDSMESK